MAKPIDIGDDDSGINKTRGRALVGIGFLVITSLGACGLLPGSSTSTTPVVSIQTPATLVFDADSLLAAAETAVATYESLPACPAVAGAPCSSPAVVTTIKGLDTTANSAIQPLVVAAQNGTLITTAEAEASQAAVTALTSYLTSQGIK